MRLAAVFAISLALFSAEPSKTARAADRASTHVVHAGQTLGRIAKRYNVSVEALRRANGIVGTRIKPGQKLLIPKPGAAVVEPKGSKSTEPRKAKASQAPQIHTVYEGQTLGKIARRYNVSVDAICHANGLSRCEDIKPKQRLIIPSPDDEDGSEAFRARRKLLGDGDEEPSARSAKKERKDEWRRYARKPSRKGRVVLYSGGQRWRGYVTGASGKVLPAAAEKMSHLLGSWRTGKKVDIDRRLLLFIAKVSDTFGGRPIRIVSGYREHSYSADSRHPRGRALDFSVDGVPNWAVRDYLRTLSGLGVGYYPNSTFVHMDVRDSDTYWVDESGPGEPPRYAHVEGAGSAGE